MKVTTVLIGAALLAADANGAVLCTSRTGSGTVRVRVTCKTNEVQLDPVALGLTGPTGATGATGAQGSTGSPGPGLVVRDATGVFVGTVVDINPFGFNSSRSFRVTRAFDGQSLSFLVFRTRIVGGDNSANGGQPFYESSDCTGTPLLSSFEDSPPSLPELVFFDFPTSSVAYYQTGIVQSRTVRSNLIATSESNCTTSWGNRATFTAPDRCCVILQPPFDNLVAEVATIDAGVLGSIPPFHVEGP